MDQDNYIRWRCTPSSWSKGVSTGVLMYSALNMDVLVQMYENATVFLMYTSMYMFMPSWSDYT